MLVVGAGCPLGVSPALGGGGMRAVVLGGTGTAPGCGGGGFTSLMVLVGGGCVAVAAPVGAGIGGRAPGCAAGYACEDGSEDDTAAVVVAAVCRPDVLAASSGAAV
jgi:hypothetical protein